MDAKASAFTDGFRLHTVDTSTVGRQNCSPVKSVALSLPQSLQLPRGRARSHISLGNRFSDPLPETCAGY